MIHNVYLQKQSQKILDLIKKAEDTFEEDDEMRSHFAKYICVLCSGFLENCVHIIYSDYVAKQTNSAEVIAFTTAMLNKIQNPNSEKFRDIARWFNSAWEVSLNNYLQENERNVAINYIMRDRHKIAHGKDSDVTLARIKENHLTTLEVISFIENQCGLIPIPDDSPTVEEPAEEIIEEVVSTQPELVPLVLENGDIPMVSDTEYPQDLGQDIDETKS